MRIVVSSKNPVKLAACKAAFRLVFPDRQADMIAVSVPSGVSEQPESDEESRLGARNRAHNARQIHPDADFWVGLEGGVEWIDGEPLASAWMVVIHHDGRLGEARTPTLPLPPAVKQLLLEGLELGEANDRVFNTAHSKQAGGAYGLLTGNRLTRESVYTEALTLALLPLSHPLWQLKGHSADTAANTATDTAVNTSGDTG